ncbi:SprT family zinc-dependent metalloprotease [Alteromonas sp. S167]|uniref:SprT family zinc-dependent metalloprotease n=1 Tax=Alteromonas sp. S167 TaxID=3117402 RepID=UPI002FDFFA28
MALSDLSPTLKHAIEDAVEHYYKQADSYFKRYFTRPTLSFRRSGKNAGSAFLQQNRINFHPVLFKENTEAFLTDVVPHEISHLLVWQLFGKVKPHGNEWQSIMRGVFNREPNTTHSFDTKSAVKTFAYQCQCNTYSLSTRRHNNVRKGTQYRCKRCNQILTPALQ